jgi:hydroxyacylglutathione hydrolase
MNNLDRMYFRQFYLGCLAQASYMIGSRGEAAVVDPRRDVDEYIEEAERQGLSIRHVIETHLHADFVSGHRELARRTGAKIYIGSAAGATFEHVPVGDGSEIRVGDVSLRFLETPGHTPESVCVVVIDGSDAAPKAVLTGDTLFIGDVGRPDLLGSALPASELAGMLYDSLHGKLLSLPDPVEVWPAHGAGSLCGKNISSETSSTIGQQRKFNYALRPMPREEFIELVTADLPEAPSYFVRDVEANRRGASALADLPALDALDPAEAAALGRDGAVFLDVRPAADYGRRHVAGSVHIGLTGQFASWAGTLLSHESPLVLVAADANAAGEARMRLARVGLERVVGWLRGGVEAWADAGGGTASTDQIDVGELRRRLAEDGSSPSFRLLDVRRPGEVRGGKIDAATAIPLHELERRSRELPKAKPILAVCAGGYRSSIATSLLERAGFTNVVNVTGGMGAWNQAGYETVTS